MPVVRSSWAKIDRAGLLAELAARPLPGEAETAAQAAEDGDTWSEEDLTEAAAAYPPPSPPTRRSPSGPASTLLRVIEADPKRSPALKPRKAG